MEIVLAQFQKAIIVGGKNLGERVNLELPETRNKGVQMRFDETRQMLEVSVPGDKGGRVISWVPLAGICQMTPKENGIPILRDTGPISRVNNPAVQAQIQEFPDQGPEAARPRQKMQAKAQQPKVDPNPGAKAQASTPHDHVFGAGPGQTGRGENVR
jgi:hypothetical protein